MEFILYVLELIMNILALLRDLFYKIKDPPPDQVLPDQLAGGGHAVSIQAVQGKATPDQAVPEQPPAVSGFRKTSEEPSQPNQLLSLGPIRVQRLQFTRAITDCAPATRLANDRERPRSYSDSSVESYSLLTGKVREHIEAVAEPSLLELLPSPKLPPIEHFPAYQISQEHSPTDELKADLLKGHILAQLSEPKWIDCSNTNGIVTLIDELELPSHSPPPSPPLSDDRPSDGNGESTHTSTSLVQLLDAPPQSKPTHIFPSMPYHETYRRITKPQYPIRMSIKGPQAFSFEWSQRWVRWWCCLLGGSDQAWKAEPDVELIKPTVKPVLEILGMDGSRIEIIPVGEGAFNKVYSVTTCNKETGSSKDYIFRIPLPIDPYYKIECDVATTEFVRHFTKIPVPLIYAYDSSPNNELGLEWMLMERVAGAPLAKSWLDLSNDQHVTLMKQVCDWQSELLLVEAPKIGGLYLRWTEADMEFFIGPSIHQVFYTDRRLLYKSNRGPFDSFRDFASAALEIQLQELNDPYHQPAAKIQKVPKQSKHEYIAAVRRKYPHFTEDDVEDYRRRISYGIPSYDINEIVPKVRALLDSLPRICPVPDDFTVLSHNDISAMNIMVDEQGQITALLDWENVEFRPMEFTRMYPTILMLEELEEFYHQKLYFDFDGNNPEHWIRVEELWSRVIATQLRPIFKKYVEDSESRLVTLDDREGFWYELKSLALDAVMYAGSLERWIKEQWDWDEDSESNDQEAEQNGEVSTPGYDGSVQNNVRAEIVV